MTQKQLAGGKFTNSYVSAIELGRVRAPLRALRVFAERLGVPLAALQGDSDDSWDATDADITAKLAYEQIHAQMLATGEDAVRGREELLAIRQRMGPDAPRSLLWYAAYAACRAGDTEAARRDAETYLRAAVAEKDERGIAAADWLFGLIYAREGDTLSAVVSFQRALEMEDRAYFDLDAAMTIRGNLSRLLLVMGDERAAASLDKQALEEYEVFADPGARVRRASALAEETARANNWQKAYRFLRWAWLSQREGAARRLAAQSYLRYALLVTGGDDALPQYELRQAFLLADASGDTETRAMAAGLLALTLAELGDAVAARQMLDAAAAGGEGMEPAHGATRDVVDGLKLTAQGWIAHAEGNGTGALQYAEAAQAALENVPNDVRLHAAAGYAAVARLYDALGASSAALSALRQAMELRGHRD